MSQNIYFYRKNGPGASFASPIVVGSFIDANEGNAVNDTAVEDFNNDGNMDFALSGGNFKSGKLQVYLGRGDGTFENPIISGDLSPHYGDGRVLRGKDAADVNGDGFIDIITSVYYGSYLGYKRIYVWNGNGDGTFDLPGINDYLVNGGSYGVVLDDYNCDGNLDILYSQGWYFYLMEGDGAGNFAAPYNFGTANTSGDKPLDRISLNPETDSTPDIVYVWALHYRDELTTANGACSNIDNGTNYSIALDQAAVAAPRYRPKYTGEVKAYWQLDEGSGSIAYDSSGNNYDGTIVGADWTPGVFGSALSFNGVVNDYVSVPNTVLDGLIDFTMEFWVKTSGSGDGIISGATSGSDNQCLLFDQSNLRVYIKQQNWRTGVSLNDGNWHHVVVTRANSTVKIYKDGVFKNSTSSLPAGPLSIAPNGLIIGQEQDSVGGGFNWSQAFNGLLDEIVVYNYVLTAEEVLARFNQ